MDPEQANEEPVPDREDQKVVWTLENGTPAPALVTIGISDGQSTEILEGPITSETLLIVDIVRPD